MNHSSNRSWLLLAAVAVAASSAAQDSRRVPADLFPLAADAEWTWTVRQKGNAKLPVIRSELRARRKMKLDGHSLWEMNARHHRSRRYEYWGVRKDGIYRYHNAMLGGMRGVSRRKPRLMLPLPAGITSKWKWQEQGSVQTMGSAAQPDPETMRMFYTGEIADMQAKVEVPAGKFLAVRINISMQSQRFGNSKESWWFVPGIGPVKRIRFAQKQENNMVYELTRFRPGVANTRNPELVARELLGKNPFNRAAPSLFKQVDQPDLGALLRSRFFVLHWKSAADTQFIRVFRNHASVFHPLNKEHWQQLIAQEGIHLTGGPADQGDAQQSAQDLTRALGILTILAEKPNLKKRIRARAGRTAYAFKTEERRVSGTCSYFDKNTNVRHQMKMHFCRDKVLTVWSDATSQKAATVEPQTDEPPRK